MRWTDCAGSPAAPASSCPCVFSRGCSVAVSRKTHGRVRRRPVAVFRRARGPLRTRCVRGVSDAVAHRRMGVSAKRPFRGPEAVLAYLARYTHRVAISNNRLTALRDGAVAFKWKDYRIKGRDRHKTMTLAAPEFIRRFSFMSCQTASIALATTACSPAAPALTTSPKRAGCSRRPRGPLKTPPMTPATPTRPILRVLALAAAVE